MHKSALTAELPGRWGRGQRLKNTLIYLALRAAVAALRALPFVLARTIAVVLGHVAATVDLPDRRRAERNLAKALPELSAREHSRISRKMFVHLAVSGIEIIHVEQFLRGPRRVRLDDDSRAVLDAAVAEGRGVMAVAGHLGNWELMAQLIAVEGYAVTSIAKPLYDPRLTRWVHHHRTRWGHQILWRGDKGLSKELLGVLRRGGVLGMLIDQDTRVRGEFVTFFGRPAHTATAPASLALRTGAAVVVGRSWRDRHEHHVVFERLDVPAEGEQETRVRELTALLSAHLETAIREHPEQWVWLHDRWKKRPPLDLPPGPRP
jgi:KDO2-lipid IV(A) lauroyltransferase